MKKIAIIDYGIGNLDSVARAVSELGCNPLVTRRAADFDIAHAIILPGVGAFSTGIKHLIDYGLVDSLHRQACVIGIPFLGICLGMQLLASSSVEGGKPFEGLGWIPGRVELLKPATSHERVPHMGWNEVHIRNSHSIFNGIESGKDFYFVHSYHFVPERKSAILAETPYCGSFVSVLCQENIIGVQFHPEKSQKIGFNFLSNFLNLY